MTATRPTARELISAAIRYHAEYMLDMTLDDYADEDDVVLRRVGYRLVQSGDRGAFECGRRLLDRAAHGRLFPPPHKRWWPGRGTRALDVDAILNPYSIELVWKDGKPRWQLGGRLWLHGGDRDWRWYRLLHVDTDAEWARTDVMWIRLGRMMQHAV